MNNPRTNELEELISRALRGELSIDEQQRFMRRLREDATLRQRFEEEKALELLLERAPKLPVPTNFTALVLLAVHKEQREPEKRTVAAWFRLRFARVAIGMAVAVAAGFFVLQQYREAERDQMARSVSAFTEVASVIGSEQTPPTAVFQDFEAIQKLSIPAETELDLELLVALQK
jgi:anti-sigma factor RsiW